MNESQLQEFLTPLGEGSSWGAKCVRRLLEADNLADVAQGLVAQNGRKPVRLVKGLWDAWGIDMRTCHAYCDRRNFPMVRLDRVSLLDLFVLWAFPGQHSGLGSEHRTVSCWILILTGLRFPNLHIGCYKLSSAMAWSYCAATIRNGDDLWQL
jgi:hypothetical protein